MEEARREGRVRGNIFARTHIHCNQTAAVMRGWGEGEGVLKLTVRGSPDEASPLRGAQNHYANNFNSLRNAGIYCT